MMNKFVLIFFCTLLCSAGIHAQDRFYTKTAKVDFLSKAPLEDIEAVNKTASAVLDTKTGAIQFAVVMKSFEFDKARMQEHFNDNYVESDKYPRAEFTGTIINNREISYTKPGNYAARVKGKMTLHGVTREIESAGHIKVEGGQLQLNSDFQILLSDYQIKVPSVVKEKLSNKIHISVDAKLEPLK